MLGAGNILHAFVDNILRQCENTGLKWKTMNNRFLSNSKSLPSWGEKPGFGFPFCFLNLLCARCGGDTEIKGSWTSIAY